jgi:hypothetical protein
VAKLKNGQGHIGRGLRNASIDSADGIAVEAQRERCAPRLSQDDRDLDLARAILEDPALYAAILQADRP